MFGKADNVHKSEARRNMARCEGFLEDALYEMSIQKWKPTRDCRHAYHNLTAAMVTLRDARVNIENIEHQPRAARILGKELDRLQNRVNRASNQFVRDCLNR